MTIKMRERMALAMREVWNRKLGSMARAHWDNGVGYDLADAALDALSTITGPMHDAAFSIPGPPDFTLMYEAAIKAARDGR